MVMGSLRQETEVAVIGAGPGGYVAALRLADLGHEVVLIDDRGRPGGTCLLEGCIPSKTLIHAVEVVDTARAAAELGLHFGTPRVDLERLRGFTAKVVDDLAQGVSSLLARRGVEVIHGRARFESDRALAVEGGAVAGVDFEHCIVATGSRARELSPPIEGVWSSADALSLPRVPDRLVVVGGGYIGLELGLVYAGLGSEVSVVELLPSLLLGADPDLVQVMLRRASRRLAAIHVDSRVAKIESGAFGFAVDVAQGEDTRRLIVDQVLVAAGRAPATEGLGLEAAGVAVDERGFIPTDEQCRSNVPHIFAIGDVAPGPMLAHKASREGKVAAEVIADQPSAFDNRAIPAVVFTDPEIAWAGLTQREAEARGMPVRIGRFPLSALGRARTLGRTDGMVKVLSEPESGLVLGVGMVGPLASELIAEATLALEMGATLEDLMVTIHPHPTLSEALLEAAEVAAGTAVHVPPGRGRSNLAGHAISDPESQGEDA